MNRTKKNNGALLSTKVENDISVTAVGIVMSACSTCYFDFYLAFVQ